MVVPKIIVCPICGKRIYLRIENGGYMLEYPIRIHCINCHALIKGSFVMDPSAGPMGLSIFNAETEDPLAEKEIDADYIAEISGELPCKKIDVFDGKLQESTPFLAASDQIDVISRIEELKLYTTKMEEWKKWKSIAFQLLAEDEMDYIPTAVRNRMGEFEYKCSDYLKSLHCLQEVVHDDTRHIFPDRGQDKTISQFLTILSSIDRTKLHDFINRVGGVIAIKAAYRKTIEVFSMFMQVYPNLLPAETYMKYKNKDDPDLGIATCSFSDIKTFYLDSYETLLSLLHYAICLDNILIRGDYLSYNPTYSTYYNNSNPYIRNRYKSLNDDFERYAVLDNGKKAELMNRSRETIQSVLSIPVKADLRNAISHNAYKYDGLEQSITIYDQKNPGQVKMVISLMEMAVDCLQISRSVVLFAEMLLFVLRQEEHQYHSIIHPRYYTNPGRNDKCPCGSAKKYKNCCMNEIDAINLQISKSY